MEPGASVEEVMVREAAVAAIDNVADLIWDGLRLSPTVTTNLKIPPAVGMPAMVPAAAESERPGGNWPDVIDHI